MSVIANDVKVLDCSTWRNRRGVEVSFINIVKGTLRSSSATSFTLQPTYKEHEFMKKSGFSSYYYETTIKAVEKKGNVTTLYSDLDFEGNAIIEVLEVEMTNEQLQEWCNENQFIKFKIDGQELIREEMEEDDWWNF